MASIFDNPATGLPTIFGPNLFEDELIEYDNVAPAFIRAEPVLTERYDLPDRDIQAEAAQLYNDQAMSDLEFREKYLEEVKQTQAMAYFSALAAGKTPQIPSVPSMPKMSSSASKPEDKELGLAWQIFRSNPPSNEREMAKFIETYKIGPTTADFLRKQMPIYDEGNLKPMYNSVGDVIYRRENADVSQEIEQGYTFEKDDAQDIAKRIQEAEYSSMYVKARKAALGQEFRTISQFSQWMEDNNIPTEMVPELYKDPLFKNLINMRQRVEMVSPEGGTEYVTVAEVAEKEKDGYYLKSDTSDIVKKAVSSAILSNYSFGTTRDELVDKVTSELVNKGLPFDIGNVSTDIDNFINQTSINEGQRTNIFSFATDVNNSLTDVLAAFKGSTQLAPALKEALAFRPDFVLSQSDPSVLYNIDGTPAQVNTPEQMIDLLSKGYTETKPAVEQEYTVTTSDTGNQETRKMTVVPDVPNPNSETDFYRFHDKDGNFVQEERYTLKGGRDRINSFKGKYQKILLDQEQDSKSLSLLMENLAAETNLTDYNAQRVMELIYDPNGIIRPSDLENIEQALGTTVFEQLQKLGKEIFSGKKINLNQRERDMLANAGWVAFQSKQQTRKATFRSEKILFDNSDLKPWDAKLKRNQKEMDGKNWNYDVQVASPEAIESMLATPNFSGTDQDAWSYYKENHMEFSPEQLRTGSTELFEDVQEEEGKRTKSQTIYFGTN